MTTSLTQYIDLYTQHAEAICAHAPAAMNALRPDALAALDDATTPKRGRRTTRRLIWKRCLRPTMA